MWHTIPFVAESRRLDAAALTDFAIANQDKYGIATERGRPEVNTWHVDQMVADFKADQADTEWEQRWPNAVTANDQLTTKQACLDNLLAAGWDTRDIPDNTLVAAAFGPVEGPNDE